VPEVHLLIAEASAVDQGEEVLSFQLCLLPFLRRIRVRGRGR
jgi:hypothetical protein